MTEFIEITGGSILKGEVTVSGAKNAALPLLIASLLTSEKCVYTNIPNLEDIALIVKLLETFGAEVEYYNCTITTQATNLIASEASYSLVKSLRASFWVLAPLLSRGGAARVALPGGDIIGARPVDMHLEALKQMGAEINLKHGVVYATAVNGLRGADINLRFPSVGATHQILMAASLVEEETIIRGAAREPEVVALCECLCQMGAEIEGKGTDKIVIKGKSSLNGASTHIIGDRIEAGTLLLCGVVTKGDITVKGVSPLYLTTFLKCLVEMGCTVDTGEDFIRVTLKEKIKSINVSTGPHPEFPTDLQAPLMAALCFANGESKIEENVFEGRFGNASELCRMGVIIKIQDRTAIISGNDSLSGAKVEALDIRSGASLIIGALGAKGNSEIFEVHHVRRGYDSIDKKISKLGGRIKYRVSDPEDYMFAGC